jgi:glycerol-3-phosphate cytidylyltransferase
MMKNNHIGYTTGIFDLFHIGHLNILKRAKLNCDYLVVGVSTDELALKLKGRSPVIPFDERIEIVKSIKYVDRAVPELTADKLEAWRDLHFNVIFKGDDWKGTVTWNQLEKDFNAVGVNVIYFPYTTTTSSTTLRGFLDKYHP